MDINVLIQNVDIRRRIFANLSKGDLKHCNLVCKTWYFAIRDYKSEATLIIKPELISKLNNQKQSIKEFILSKHKHAKEITIYGWSKRSGVIPNDIYDSIFDSSNVANKFTLVGRGVWDTCRCPKEISAIPGSQVDNITESDKTNLELIIVRETFTISSCALLDLVSRSPNLKTLIFHGVISKHEHYLSFYPKVFYCSLKQIYWPFPTKKQIPTVTTLVKRNDEIRTFYCNIQTTCDLLAAEKLNKVRFLSLNLNEDWNCQKGVYKKPFKYLERTKLLLNAKNIEALEIRTFDLPEVSEDPETVASVERIFENYKISLWEQVSRLPKLKYLAVYGAWDLESVCSELAKHGIQIEYLRFNLLPKSVMEAIDEGDDNPVISMVEAVRNIRKLTSLRSIHYTCADKLANIGNKTILVLKELLDIIWVFDVKVRFTPEVEDFMNNVVRRGNQQGKTYEVEILVAPTDNKYADILIEQKLRAPHHQDLKEYLQSTAEKVVKERYGRNNFDSIYIWGIRLINSVRDRSNFDKIKMAWRRYDKQFNPDGLLV